MINISNLQKRFADKAVIHNLNLKVDSGEITALVGKNGAGKSTLIRLICGLLKPDDGQISVFKNASIGVLLGGDVNLYANLTGYENISYFSQLHGINKRDMNGRIDELNKVLNFKDFMNERTACFSRGMRQKIAFVISIIHNPDILLLDEPSTGLDIEASNDVIQFIKYLKLQNKTILVATHNIFEISDLSDSIAFLNQGKIQKKVNTKQFFCGCDAGDKSKLIIQAMEDGACQNTL